MHIENRSQYKETWDNLAGSSDNAKLYVAGHTDEAELDRTGLNTVNRIERLVGIRPTDICLEIGCGIGRVGKFLSPKCAQWIGTDISGQMLRYAAERLAGLDNIELIELSTVGLSEIPDSSIDMVYCTVVFMHLYEWDRYRYILEAFRVLKPGGRCFFDNLDITSKRGWEMFMEGFSYPIDRRPAHLSMCSTGDELYTYAKKAGLERVEVHRWGDARVGVTGVKPGRSRS
ncbi:class I SAM-dependent methyltransferase [Oxynema aestuarii]|uniref:Class I SAM-dependent methyltransferase n=1 Tax=Oxynema aestuarii AP17 TaxID=2064643 RepID=A0A6H1U4J4_9CYAN|nr:class I SAM-dependent methyltransferase [Oxynema aestuarii]QIZ73346.1 class I SAM-dependent methyltransferase [Oxynema aestuarii AP17]RMH71744.1 MAG: class I SAM-dependent methyltransferase [Cyanobacteria bacterium J007]